MAATECTRSRAGYAPPEGLDLLTARERWTLALEELTGSTFYAPAEPLVGDQLAQEVSDVIGVLDNRRPAVVTALRGLYGGAL